MTPVELSDAALHAWNHPHRIWMAAGLGVYCIAFLLSLIGARWWRSFPRVTVIALVAIGFLFHSIGVFGRGFALGACPVGNPFESIQFIVWSLILLYLAIGSTYRTSTLGFFGSGLAAFFGLFSFLLPQWDQPHSIHAFGGNPWIESHAALALFSYGVFAFLALTSLMYLLQHYGLKHKRTQGLFRFLPSIFQLEKINFRMLLLSASVYSAAIVIGGIGGVTSVAGETPPTAITSKIISALVLWLAYLTILTLRIFRKLHTIRLAWSCLILFLVALFTLWPVEMNRSHHHAGVPAQDTTTPAP